VDHVADGCAGGRSDDANTSWKERNRAFQFRGEQTFLLQTRLCLFKGQLQSTGADRLERICNQLVFAFWFIDRETATRANLQAVFRAKADALIAAAVT